jgi:predicted nucleic acid-binding protein
VRVILDTNVVLSALIRRDSAPGQILEAWLEGRFVQLTHHLLLDELRTVTRRLPIRALIQPAGGTAGQSDLSPRRTGDPPARHATLRRSR